MSTFLLKSVKIVDPQGSWHQQTVDVLVKSGRISAIAPSLPSIPQGITVQEEGLCLSPGWFDIGAVLQDPGYEYKEDLSSLAQAAIAGGFTDIAPIPQTNPAIHSKEGVAFLKASTQALIPSFHPIANITQAGAGEQMTEMVDLHHAGAIAFSDGIPTKYDTGILKLALQYLQTVDGLLITHAQDQGLRKGGQMHEGHISTMLGMKGIPSMSEEMGIFRDLKILDYTQGRLHLSALSTKEGVALVKAAKAKGLRVTCDVAAHQMSYTDASLSNFDTHFKVDPPFRSTDDIQALWKGLKDGTIDAIVSAHTPQDIESKELEFDLADFGIIGLETAFASLRTKQPDNISLDTIIAALTHKPRAILGLPKVHVVEGVPAKLTLFNPDEEWVYERPNIRSKSHNSPFIGQKLKGKPFGVINGEKHFFLA